MATTTATWSCTSCPRKSCPPALASPRPASARDEDVSVLRNRLGTGGSEVRFGNLLLVPIDNALLYVQPFYVVGEGRNLPLLQQVIVTYGDEVVIEETLAEALTSIFGQTAVTQEQPGEPTPGEADTPPEGTGTAPDDTAPSGTAAEQAASLLDQANELFAEADTALTNGDLGIYEDRVEEARDLVEQAIDLLGADGSGPAPTTTTTPPARSPTHPDQGSWRRGKGPVRCRSHNDAGWSSLVARRAHNPKVAGSNPAPATKQNSRSGPVPRTGSSASGGPRPHRAAVGQLCDHVATPERPSGASGRQPDDALVTRPAGGSGSGRGNHSHITAGFHQSSERGRSLLAWAGRLPIDIERHCRRAVPDPVFPMGRSTNSLAANGRSARPTDWLRSGLGAGRRSRHGARLRCPRGRPPTPVSMPTCRQPELGCIQSRLARLRRSAPEGRADERDPGPDRHSRPRSTDRCRGWEKTCGRRSRALYPSTGGRPRSGGPNDSRTVANVIYRVSTRR